MKASMFLKFVTVLTLSTVAFTAPVQAGNGGNGSGGGDVAQSTRADLEEVVQNLSRHIDEVSDRYLFGGEIELTHQPLSPRLRQVTTSVTGSSAFAISEKLTSYVKGLKFNIVNGSCLEDGVEKDASTTFHINSTVCFSASRLARFPRSGLKEAVIPLIFHEAAHQFGFNEADAMAFQKLTELHIRYRQIYLASFRTYLSCGMLTKTPLTQAETNDILATAPDKMKRLPKVSGQPRLQGLMYCASHSALAGEGLVRNFNGDLWSQQFTSLTSQEVGALLAYDQIKDNRFSFEVIERALNGPPESGYTGCRNCKAGGIDPAYIMMLGAKSAMTLIDTEVGRLQSQIN